MSDNGGDTRIMAEHGIYALTIATLNSQMQIKFPNSSPVETHYGLFYTFVGSLLLYALASACQIQLCCCCAERSPPLLPLAVYSRLLGGAVSLIAPLFILELNVLAWAVLAAFVAKVCYDFRSFLWSCCLVIVGGYILSKWKKLVEPYVIREHPVPSFS